MQAVSLGPDHWPRRFWSSMSNRPKSNAAFQVKGLHTEAVVQATPGAAARADAFESVAQSGLPCPYPYNYLHAACPVPPPLPAACSVPSACTMKLWCTVRQAPSAGR